MNQFLTTTTNSGRRSISSTTTTTILYTHGILILCCWLESSLAGITLGGSSVMNDDDDGNGPYIGPSFPIQPIDDGTGSALQPIMVHPATGLGYQDVQTGFIAQSEQLPDVLGAGCADNSTCESVPNSYCSVDDKQICACIPDFIVDSMFPTTCKLAPGYNEKCNNNNNINDQIKCRSPFSCNSTGFCDCPLGTIQEYFQCIPDCPEGQVPAQDKCYKGVQLGESCSVSEQCMQSYSKCLHGQCQCIPGANQFKGSCYPVNQCPLGEVAKDRRGSVLKCKGDADPCPNDYYCLYAEFSDNKGFCCPKIQMNCPIGKALEGVNCTSCPWDTHHCFSYVIGTYTQTMCCPNACPSSQPIQTGGQCYARAAYGGHCMVNEQCYTVAGASCREDEERNKRCLCPVGNYKNYFGKCIRESVLGEECKSNEECQSGTNTVCLEGVCTCYQGYMPTPHLTAPISCIAEPSCPTSQGILTVKGDYVDCSDEESACVKGDYCRKWWYDGNITFALCCPKPKLDDYQAICAPFRMDLILVVQESNKEAENHISLEDVENTPLPCDLTPQSQPLFFRDAQGHVQTSNEGDCPPGGTCIFNPYAVNGGVCCQPPNNVPIKMQKIPAAGAAGASSASAGPDDADVHLPSAAFIPQNLEKSQNSILMPHHPSTASRVGGKTRKKMQKKLLQQTKLSKGDGNGSPIIQLQSKPMAATSSNTQKLPIIPFTALVERPEIEEVLRKDKQKRGSGEEEQKEEQKGQAPQEVVEIRGKEDMATTTTATKPKDLNEIIIAAGRSKKDSKTKKETTTRQQQQQEQQQRQQQARRRRPIQSTEPLFKRRSMNDHHLHKTTDLNIDI